MEQFEGRVAVVPGAASCSGRALSARFAGAGLRVGFADVEQGALGSAERALFRAARSGQAIGTPDTIPENIKQYEEQNLDVLSVTAQAGDRKHEHIMETIELFGTQVRPEFKDRHETHHRKWREQQHTGVEFPINSSI